MMRLTKIYPMLIKKNVEVYTVKDKKFKIFNLWDLLLLSDRLPA